MLSVFSPGTITVRLLVTRDATVVTPSPATSRFPRRESAGRAHGMNLEMNLEMKDQGVITGVVTSRSHHHRQRCGMWRVGACAGGVRTMRWVSGARRGCAVDNSQ